MSKLCKFSFVFWARTHIKAMDPLVQWRDAPLIAINEWSRYYAQIMQMTVALGTSTFLVIQWFSRFFHQSSSSTALLFSHSAVSLFALHLIWLAMLHSNATNYQKCKSVNSNKSECKSSCSTNLGKKTMWTLKLLAHLPCNEIINV
jgi:hypothetical protein